MQVPGSQFYSTWMELSPATAIETPKPSSQRVLDVDAAGHRGKAPFPRMNLDKQQTTSGIAVGESHEIQTP
jgi:hypothetical protein